jgi:septation ring formation regulator
LYDTFQAEIDAQKYVKTNRQTIKDYIEHAKKNNRALLIELDHISQSYTLNNNELGRARGYQTEIDELERQQNQLSPQIDDHKVAYSEAKGVYKESYKVLDDIEAQQVNISTGVQDLRKDEKEAQGKVDDFEFKLRAIKRYVEKQRLPGLPVDYLEFFFVASDRVELLESELNKVSINIDEIKKLVKYCNEDLEILQTKTDEMIDSSALAEQMMQYANRYRHNNPDVAQAIQKALHLFTDEYKYKEALDEIGAALERVEPGAFERIEKFYYNHRDLT